MALTLAEIEKEIRSLDSADRDRLLRDLVADLDGEADKEVDAAWLVEADRRYEELQSGAVKAVPVDDVLREARARLKHGG